MDGSTSPAMGLTAAERAALLDGAADVLDRNWRGDHTVPAGELYPHQWSWDTAFIAIGRSWIDQDRAQQELEHLFTGQWSNGMVPHIVFNPAVPDDAYFPGPDFWRSGAASAKAPAVATSGITQPPLHARAVREVVAHAADRGAALAFAERMYPRLVAHCPPLTAPRSLGHRLGHVRSEMRTRRRLWSPSRSQTGSAGLPRLAVATGMGGS